MAMWQDKNTMRVTKFHGENFCGEYNVYEYDIVITN